MSTPLRWILVGDDPFHEALAEGTNADGQARNPVGKVYRQHRSAGLYFHWETYDLVHETGASPSRDGARAEVERRMAKGRKVLPG